MDGKFSKSSRGGGGGGGGGRRPRTRVDRLATWALLIVLSMAVVPILFFISGPILSDGQVWFDRTQVSGDKLSHSVAGNEKDGFGDPRIGPGATGEFSESLQIVSDEEDISPTRFTTFGSRFQSKFYIYQAEIPPALYRIPFRTRFCRQQHFAAEMLFPEAIFFSDLYTSDPELADFYVVPIQPSCFISMALQRGVSLPNSIKSFNELFNRTLANIMTGHSFWQKTHGRDHIFVFMSEEGLDLIDESTWPLVRKSIFLTAPTQGGVSTAQRFDTFRDIVLPAYVPNFAEERLALPTERQVKIFFRGTFRGNSIGDHSEQMISQARAYENVHLTDLEVRPDCVNATALKCHAEDMENATFCLVPAGIKGWSKRLTLALMSRCVPVLIIEGQELPFEDLVDWEKFSIKVLPTQLSSIIDILEGEENNANVKTRLLAERLVFYLGGNSLSTAYPKEKLADKYKYLQDIGHNLSLYGVELGRAFDLALRVLDTRKYRFFRNSQSVFWTDSHQVTISG